MISLTISIAGAGQKASLSRPRVTSYRNQEGIASLVGIRGRKYIQKIVEVFHFLLRGL